MFLGAAGLAVSIGGCGRAVVDMETPVPVAASEYDRVFDAATLVLREQGFMPARQDRRFGVITTRPCTASSAFEPWRSDNTTAAQVAENTLNHRRRLVRVELRPRPAGGDGSQPSPADAARPDYLLDVVVELQQRQHPPRNLHTAAASSVAYYGRSGGARAIRTERGLERSDWRPLGRDPFLEQRLAAAILDRAAKAASTTPDDPS